MKLYIKKTTNKQGTKETLWIDFTHNGKRYRKSLKLDNTPKNVKLAETRLIPKLSYEIANGEFFKITMPTVDEFMKVSFELNNGNRCDSTIKAHLNNYNKHIKPIFGNKKLDELASKDFTLWQNNLQKKERLAKRTIIKVRGLLNSMYEDAIDDKLLTENPIKKVKQLNETENPKVARQKLKPFKTQEIKKILNSCSSIQDKNLLSTLFFTGMRAGELIGLKWDAIDFENKTITIRGQVVNGRDKEMLKTSKSNRIIPLIDALIPSLKNQYKLTGHQKSFVFLTQKTNKHYHSAGKLREQIWIKVLEKANIEYRNLHQCRGTFISTLIAAGEDITYVSKIAGHANLQVTLEHYSEYIPVQNKNFGNCFKKV